MTLFDYTNPHMIVADKNKHIRDKEDIYIPEHIDEEIGEVIPEHLPYYATIIFVPNDFKESDMYEKYIEEIKEV